MSRSSLVVPSFASLASRMKRCWQGSNRSRTRRGYVITLHKAHTHTQSTQLQIANERNTVGLSSPRLDSSCFMMSTAPSVLSPLPPCSFPSLTSSSSLCIVGLHGGRSGGVDLHSGGRHAQCPQQPPIHAQRLRLCQPGQRVQGLRSATPSRAQGGKHSTERGF